MSWWKDFQHAIKEHDNEKIQSMLKEVSIPDAQDDSGDSLLHYVASNEIITKQLIEAGCDVNKKNRFGETPLFEAVMGNHLKVAKLLIDTGSLTVNTSHCEDNFGPLHMAVYFGFNDMVRLLIEAGADVDAVDEEYSSPIHIAAKAHEVESAEITKMLIDAGASLNRADYMAITPLHWAAMRGNYVVAGLLLDAGARADCMDDNFVTPLHWAVRDLHIEFSERLIEAGAEVDMVDNFGMTCLHYAVKSRATVMTKMLLEAGATPNCTDDQGYSPLHWAVRHMDIFLVQMLLEHGADVNIQDDEDAEGLSALMIASEHGLKNIILLLLSYGADVRAKCNRGYSVMYYAAMSRKICYDVDDDSYVEILELLLDHGADIGDNSYNIKTPFNSVLLYGNERAVRLFLERGIDLNKCILGKSKISSLHHAALNNNPAVLEYLIDSGHFGIEDKCGSGLTALNLAAFSDKPNCIKFLLRRGADVNNANKYGETPLYSAIINGHTDCVQLLLDAGADINAITTRNELVLHIALERNKDDIVYRIVRHVAKLEAQDKPVRQAIFDIINDCSLQDFYENCRIELAVMEGCILDGSITLFNILTSPEIGSYARNETIIETFESQDFAPFFPIYKDMLNVRFEKELKRQKLMKNAMKGASRILGYDAETFWEVFYNIFSYLNEKDLKNLESV